MSKLAKVRLADILFLAGYQKISILDAIRYPKCIAIRLISIQSEPPPESIEVKIFSNNDQEEAIIFTDLGEETPLKTPVYPIMSYCDFGASLTMGFSFGTRFNQKLWGTYLITIPAPAEWPIPSFLKPKEEPEA